MKKINIKSGLYILPILFGILLFLNSCIKDKDAEDPVVPKTMEEYRSGLLQLVESEKKLLDTTIIGYNKNDFKVASTTSFTPFKTAYKIVLDTAYARLNRSGITIASIVAIDKTLSIPGKAFWGALFPSDRRPLNVKIVEAETLNAATLAGTAVGQVPQEAKTAYTTAITNARKTRDAAVTIDRQVTDAIKILDEATTTFKAAIIK